LTSQKSLSSDKEKKARFFYGQIIILASFLIVLISWGAMYSYGVFFKPVLNEFGWTRAVTSGAYSLNMVLTGAFYILSGRLADRFGPRLVLSVGALLIGLGYLLMSTVSSVWQYYLYYGVLVSIGMGCIVVPLMSNVARWFVKGRGLASGIVISGIGVGIVVMPQVANKLISSYSWRTSFTILGVISLALIVSFAQLLRRALDQRNLSTQDAKNLKTSSLNPQVQGLSTREAIGTRQFWIICLFGFLLSYCVQTAMVHIVVHTTDIGFTATTAATILSAIGFVSIFGKISMGSLGDRIGNRNALIIISILMTLAFVWLRFASNLWMLYLFAAVFAVGYAGFSATQSPLAAEFFGLKAHGTLFGWTQFAGNAGGALGAFIAGCIFDTSGSYQLAFLSCALIGAACLILSILLHPARKQDQVRALDKKKCLASY
jgi:MFS family permease